jgi:hypothetical protein
MFDNLPPSLEHIRSGKLRALGVTTKERASSVPELPTIAETVPGYETYSWNALFAPTGTPRPIIDRLNAAALAALADPEVAAKLKDLSIESVGSTPMSRPSSPNGVPSSGAPEPSSDHEHSRWLDRASPRGLCPSAWSVRAERHLLPQRRDDLN